MATIKIDITVEELDSVLEVFDVIKVYRSTTTDDPGQFTELTTGANRISLEEGIKEYEFIDTAGEATYFYRTSYFHSITLLESSLSAAQRGAQDAALDVLSVDQLKTNYLFGIDLTDDTGTPYPDSMFEFYIKSAVAFLEQKLDIPIIKIIVKEERHDYYRDDYDKYIWIETNHFPVVSIEEVKLVLPGEQVVQIFDKDWIHIQRESGQIELVPGTGTAGSILLGASGAWIPLIYGNNRFIPDAFRIKYTAGFGPPPVGSYGFPQGSNPPSVSVPDPHLDRGLPQNIIDMVGMQASLGPLGVAGDLLGGAGIASQSIGIDGLSQSFSTTSSATNAGYGARIIQYREELKRMIPEAIQYFKGIRMRVA